MVGVRLVATQYIIRLLRRTKRLERMLREIKRRTRVIGMFLISLCSPKRGWQDGSNINRN